MEIFERAEYFRQEDKQPRETLAVTKADLRRAIESAVSSLAIDYLEFWPVVVDWVWEDLQNGVRSKEDNQAE